MSRYLDIDLEWVRAKTCKAKTEDLTCEAKTKANAKDLTSKAKANDMSSERAKDFWLCTN